MGVATTKQRIKTVMAVACYHAGLLDGYRFFVLKNKAFVLMYHRVLPGDFESQVSVQSGMFVSERSFNHQIDFLKKNFNIVPLAELTDRKASGKDLKNLCSITFDDGWLDNYQYAFPILKKFNVPATIFLTTGFVGTCNWFWPDEIYFYLKKIHKAGLRSLSLPKVVLDLLNEASFFSCSCISETIEIIIEKVKHFLKADRNEFISSLKGQFAEKKKERLIMNWEEVREMYDSKLVSFASHTVTHALLDQLTVEQVRVEICDSINQIRDELGDVEQVFAYPNGNLNSDVIRVLQDEGVTVAVTTRRGYVDHNTNLMEIPRIGLHNDVSASPAQFLWRILVR